MNDVANNIVRVRNQISRLCADTGRTANKVTLVAVSKQQSDERIAAALAAGHRVFGENRVQEARQRWEARRSHHPDLELHLIGPLQTNKAGSAVALFDVIETVDRPQLADAILAEGQKQKKIVRCFVQVNTGAEPQKSGVSPENLSALLAHCRSAGLAIDGLMCIPPATEPPALHFALLKKLAEEHGIQNLSMGMSADFEKAIALGANYVRIGTGIFGARNGQ